MIRFVDLTAAYWTDAVPDGSPLAGFISTVDDRFIENLDGTHTFHGFDEIDEHPQGARMRALVPEDFFTSECIDVKAFNLANNSALAERLIERLSRRDAGFVMRLFSEDNLCGNCFEEGPFCCYDPDER